MKHSHIYSTHISQQQYLFQKTHTQKTQSTQSKNAHKAHTRTQSKHAHKRYLRTSPNWDTRDNETLFPIWASCDSNRLREKRKVHMEQKIFFKRSIYFQQIMIDRQHPLDSEIDTKNKGNVFFVVNEGKTTKKCIKHKKKKNNTYSHKQTHPLEITTKKVGENLTIMAHQK